MSAIGKNPATVGTTSDIANRIRVVMPPWFPDAKQAPVFTSMITAIADAFNFIYQTLQFADMQTRINTATGGWLDLIAWDYFAGRFVRRASEPDSSFRPRILIEILRPRDTRAAILTALLNLTGRAETVVREAWNTGDYGSYNINLYYGAGLFAIGSLNYPNQIFLDAFRPTGAGIPVTTGLGGNTGGFGVGSFGFINLQQISGQVTDAEIEAKIEDTIAAGTTVWLDIHT